MVLPYHGLVCTAGPPRGIATTRHEVLKQAMAECVRQCTMDLAVPCQIVSELEFPVAGGHNIKVDLVLKFNPGTPQERKWLVDVSIREPCSRHGFQPSPFVHRNACRNGEAEKVRYLTPITEQYPNCVIKPFVLESAGSIGPLSQEFLRELTKFGSKRVVRKFLEIVSNRMGIYLARITLGAVMDHPQ